MAHLLRRTGVILLAAMLAMPTLSSCNWPVSQQAEEDVQPITISFWNIGTESPALELWQYAPDQYNQNDSAESGYIIETSSTVNDQYKQKLVVAMSANECPDMYVNWSGGSLQEYIDAGFAQPLDDLMGEYVEVYTDASVAQGSYDGRLYAIPIMANSIAGVFYNTEIYADLGLEEPETLAQLEYNCDMIVEAGYTPFALANATQWTGSIYYMYFVVRYAGVEAFNLAVEGSGSFEDDCFVYAGEKIQEWVEAGYFPQGVNGLDDDSGQARQMMYSETAVMQLSGSWTIGTYSTDSPEFYEKVGYFSFPAIEEGYEDDSIVVGTMGDNFISFNCTGEKLVAACNSVKYYSDETCIEMLVDSGRIPPLKEVYYDDPLMIEVAEEIAAASTVQLWYDQYLPSAVADVHKTETQKLFDLSSTPEDVATAQEVAMEAYLADKIDTQ